MFHDLSAAFSDHYNHYPKRFKKLRWQAGFEKWNANAMRRSFGTYSYALNGNSNSDLANMRHHM